jgi:hypothetical protein
MTVAKTSAHAIVTGVPHTRHLHRGSTCHPKIVSTSFEGGSCANGQAACGPACRRLANASSTTDCVT